jgi:tRNA threonylcarbamoyladenosine biosynthesis protein TsaE
MDGVTRHIKTESEEETIAAGAAFAAGLHAGDIIALYDDLGTGKTQFVKGVCRGLGIAEHITSPTFVILNEYLGGRLPAYHFDFYRLKSKQELREIGFEEYLFGDGVCLLEWANRIEDELPVPRYEVKLELGAHHAERVLQIKNFL